MEGRIHLSCPRETIYSVNSSVWWKQNKGWVRLKYRALSWLNSAPCCLGACVLWMSQENSCSTEWFLTSEAANAGRLMSFKLLSISLGGWYFPTEHFTWLGPSTMGDRPVTNRHFHLTHPHATSPRFFTLQMNFRSHFTWKRLGQGSVALLYGHKARLCVSVFSPVSHSKWISGHHLKHLTEK